MDRFIRQLLIFLGIALVIFEGGLALAFHHSSVSRIQEDCIRQLNDAKVDLDTAFSPQNIYKKVNIDTAFLVRIQAGLNYGTGSTVAETHSIVNSTHFLAAAKKENSSAVHSIYVVLLDDDSPYMLTDSGLVSRKYMSDKLWQKSYQNCRNGDFCEFRVLPTAQGDGQAPASVITAYHHIVSRHWDTGELIEGCIIVNYHFTPFMLQLKRTLPFAEAFCLYDATSGKYHTVDDMLLLPESTVREIMESDQLMGDVQNGKQIYFHERSDVLSIGYILLCNKSSLFRMANYQSFALGMADGLVVMCFLLFYIIYRQQNRKYRYNIRNILELSGGYPGSASYGLLPIDRNGELQEYLLSKKVSKKEMQSLLQNENAMRMEMEMLALQSQINPHFLLNTVDFLYWNQVGESGFFSEQSVMMENLCKILKYALDASKIVVPLKDELEHARAYLEIQGKRNGQKANVIMDIPPELEQAEVMKLILQPILENCYKYGMPSDSDRPMTITVRVRQEGADLVMAVIDTGSGMSDEQIQKVNYELKNAMRRSRHIGLANINRRLQLYYGEGSGLVLSRSDGGGLTVTARMTRIRMQPK